MFKFPWQIQFFVDESEQEVWMDKLKGILSKVKCNAA